MLSASSAPQLTGSPGQFVKVPEAPPLQILLTPQQSILAYADCKRYSMKFSKDTWDQIWKILTTNGVEVFEMQGVKPGGIKFHQKNSKGDKSKD